MRTLIKGYLKESLSNKVLSEDFIDLIKHNFKAKFVYYNPKKNVIEVGVEDPNSDTYSYPEINIFSFPVTGTTSWLDESLKKNKNDMNFYGRLLNRNNPLFKDAEVVVL
ncbi:hypothetical protein ACKGJN_00110 [Gillisia sp. Q332]|uniref:hypothetical protein n=1 Tax=Gillisia xinjiangensis TaxID=3384765 RepID=UPI00391CA144